MVSTLLLVVVTIAAGIGLYYNSVGNASAENVSDGFNIELKPKGGGEYNWFRVRELARSEPVISAS